MSVPQMLREKESRWLIVAGVACWATFVCSVAAAAGPKSEPPKPLRLQMDQDVTMEVRGHTIATYRATPSPNRPFLRELWTPGGVQVLRDSPHDHKHHHGLMFALAVDGLDFWCDEPTCGRQVPKPLEDVQAGGAATTSRIGFTQPVDWTAPGGTVSLRERRTITAFADPKIDATLLTWRSILSAPGDKPVKLGGWDFSGLGTRFVVSMDGKGKFFNSEGHESAQIGPDGVSIDNKRVTQSKWCAYTATADNRLVTIAMFHHPKNPTHYFCHLHIPGMFAFLTGALGVDRKPIEVKPGAPLDLRFGVALWDGEIDKGRVEAMYQKWVELEPVKE
jgi:hypothetical protein